MLCTRSGSIFGSDRVDPLAAGNARAVCALLMHVVDDLRTPGIEDLFNSESRFDLREGVPVAVVIVTDVLMVERDWRPFPSYGVPRYFLIPIHD